MIANTEICPLERVNKEIMIEISLIVICLATVRYFMN